MSKVGKRLKALKEKYDHHKLYKLEEAVEMVKNMAVCKFDEAVDVVFNLGVDPRHANQMVRGVCNLPHGSGRKVRVAVFARGDKAVAAKEAGAYLVGAEDLIETIQGGQIDFDRAIATPEMMPLVGRLGRILGARGLMPNPRVGTVTDNVEEAVKGFVKGAVEFRVEKAGLVHAVVGKAKFDSEKLCQNIKALLEAIKLAKPEGVKGTYLKGVGLSSSMGPGVKVDLSEL